MEKLEGRIAQLNTKLEPSKFDREELENEFLAQGKMNLMKVFMKKVPTFDRNIFGVATAGYAENLHKKMAGLRPRKKLRKLQPRKSCRES